MSGGDEIRAELVRAVNQSSELQILIAHHARIRRATGLVFVGEILDDVLLEFRRLVNEVIRDVELVADGARVGDGLRAAAFVLRAVHAILRPELERDADDIVALLDQKRRRRRGINSSAHAADDALTLLRIHRRTLYNARAACKMVCASTNQSPFQCIFVSGRRLIVTWIRIRDAIPIDFCEVDMSINKTQNIFCIRIILVYQSDAKNRRRMPSTHRQDSALAEFLMAFSFLPVMRGRSLGPTSKPLKV